MFGEKPTRDARLIRKEKHQIACIVKTADRLGRVRSSDSNTCPYSRRRGLPRRHDQNAAGLSRGFVDLKFSFQELTRISASLGERL